ncbi:MAG: hypothetical protein AB7S26_37680 [Sandaracinaceae bacterium]
MRALVVVALGALWTGCCFCPIGLPEQTEEERAASRAREAEREAEREAARQAAIARATPRARTLDRVAALIDPHAPVAATECPDDEIEAARGGFQINSMFTPTLDYGALPGVTPSTPPEWRWLVNDRGANLLAVRERGEAASDQLREQVGDVTHRYVAVFVTQSRTLPAVTREPGVLREGEWTPGSYRGGVHIVDLDAAQVICSAPFETTSHAEVEGDDLAEAILEDFQERVEASATDSLQEHTVHFNLNLIGWL